MRNSWMKRMTCGVTLLALTSWIGPASAQVRGNRRGAVAKGEEGRADAAGPRGVAVKGEEGYAAAGRHGAVAKGDEGSAAVGRRGAVVEGEDGYARVGPHGAVVAGEEGYGAVGRRGVVVGDHYESYEGWKIAAGVATGIAIGTMLAKPPKTAVTVTVAETSYYYASCQTARWCIRWSARPRAPSLRRCPRDARRCNMAASPTVSADRPTISGSATAIRS